MNISPTEYIRVLVPEDREVAQVTPSLPSHVMSLHSLRALPLLEQCRMLLKDGKKSCFVIFLIYIVFSNSAKIIQFQQLYLLLAGGEGITAEALLKCLPQVAVLVRGNWIVKSEVLYPTGTLSAISGVPAEHMCKARDYVVSLKSYYLGGNNKYYLFKIAATSVHSEPVCRS